MWVAGWFLHSVTPFSLVHCAITGTFRKVPYQGGSDLGGPHCSRGSKPHRRSGRRRFESLVGTAPYRPASANLPALESAFPLQVQILQCRMLLQSHVCFGFLLACRKHCG